MAYTRVYITAIKIEAPITSVMECCFLKARLTCRWIHKESMKQCQMPYAFETIRSGAVRCGRQGSCIRGILLKYIIGVYHWYKSYSATCRKSCPVHHPGAVSDRSDKSCKSVRIRTCRLSGIMRNAKILYRML